MTGEQRTSKDQRTSQTILNTLKDDAMKITVPARVLVNALRAVATAASRDGMRPHLNSVWLRALSGDRVHAFATDGNWLAVCRLDGATVGSQGLAGVRLDDLPNLVAVLPKGALREPPVVVEMSEKTLRFDATHTGLSLRTLDGFSPPPIQTVVPKGKSTRVHERAAINIHILGAALKSVAILAKGRARMPGVKLYAMGKTALDPQLLCSAACPEFFALMMPLRDPGKRSMGWWDDVAATLDAADAADKAARAAAAKVATTEDAAE